MALTKESITDKVECLCDNFHILQIRERNVVKEDGVIIADKFHRRQLTPGFTTGLGTESDPFIYNKTDTSEETEMSITSIISSCWTDDLHESYANHIGATIVSQ